MIASVHVQDDLTLGGQFGFSAIACGDDVALISGDGGLSLDRTHKAIHTQKPIISVCSAPHHPQALLLGGDDGRVTLLDPDGTCHMWAQLGHRWIEHIVSTPHAVAIASSKTLVFLKPTGEPYATHTQDSSITGIAFDQKSKRCAVSHYNGASLYWLSGQGAALRLVWKGSHTGIAFSPDGQFVITAMQELALHGWIVGGAKNMHMSGYTAKTQSMAWCKGGKYLATSGAPDLICWPFLSKDGPMGKAPVELPGAGALITQVACHPQQDWVAAGFANGAILLFRLSTGDQQVISRATGSAVSGLAFSRSGTILGFIREDGSGGRALFA